MGFMFVVLNLCLNFTTFLLEVYSYMGVQPSRSPDFYDRYPISRGNCLSQSKQPVIDNKYIASVLHLTSGVDYAHLKTVIYHKMNSSSNYITKLHDKLESQSIKICSNHQRMTVVYRQSGMNLIELWQSRKNARRSFKEEDAIYLIECVARGLQQFKRIGDASQILTPSCIVLDVDGRFKVLDPFLIASDSFSQERTYTKQVEYIYGLWNKFSGEEIKKKEMRFKYLICQTEEKNVDGFNTSLFALGCICLKLLNFDFDLENYFDSNYNKLNKSLQFDWSRYRTHLKSIKNQNLRQKLWLLTSQYHNQRNQVFEFLDRRFDDNNYSAQLLLRNTSLWFTSKQGFQDENGKLSLAHYQGSLKQSITIIPAPSNKLQIKESDVKRTLTTFSSTNHSQLHTHPVSYQQHSPLGNANPNYFTNITFNDQTMMKRSLPVTVLYSPLPTFTYSPNPTVQNSQIIKATHPQNLQQLQSFQHPVIRITCNHIRNLSLQQMLSKKSFINELQDEHLKTPVDQKMAESKKRIKTLDDLQQNQQESIHAEVQDYSQHSQNVQRVDINQVFPGYSQPTNFTEELSPISHIQTFQQPPLHQILVNGVIQEDSAENSLSQQSEVQNQSQFVIQEYTNGGRYQGYKHNQMRQGYGKLFFSNGQIYDGQWKNNKMHGYGKLYYNQSTLVYQGFWKNDSLHGSGNLFNLQIQPMKSACDFLNFSTNCNSWKKYEGEFIDDIKQGRGRLTYQNDEYFQGEFNQDKISGKGFFVGQNGQKIRGEWCDWKLVKIY